MAEHRGTPSGSRLVELASLRAFVDAAAAAAGVPSDQRELFVAGLVEADLRGVSSHGVVRLPPYIRAFDQGIVDPAPEVTLVHEHGAISLLDGGNGIGIVVGQLAMRRAIEQARRYGIAAVAVSNSNHAGMLASYVLQAAEQGMVGYFTSNSPAIMPPWGGITPKLGNGPFAFAIPADGESPVVLDMACSAVARGKVRLHAARAEPIPIGWALDDGGRPTQDPAAALAGVLLPMAGYKGYGIAFINEILAAALAGAAFATEMPRAFLSEGSIVLDQWSCGHFMLAIDLACFGRAQETREAVGKLIAEMRSAQTLSEEAILVPGEPEQRERARRLIEGIPVGETTLVLLDALADELGIAPLRRVAPQLASRDRQTTTLEGR